MGRATVSEASPSDLYLIPGEVSDTHDVEDARQWVTIYRELVTFAERTLSRLADRRGLSGLAASGSDADARALEGHLRRLKGRLDFWERRLWELAGLDLDIRSRVLTNGGRSVMLTRREAELLGFLAQRPGQFFSAPQLVALAWSSAELSPEQLRTYVVRLRRHLATAQAPARLVSEPRRGYGLVFTS
jgi:DNA-binding response OmpR family regulator